MVKRKIKKCDTTFEADEERQRVNEENIIDEYWGDTRGENGEYW